MEILKKFLLPLTQNGRSILRSAKNRSSKNKSGKKSWKRRLLTLFSITFITILLLEITLQIAGHIYRQKFWDEAANLYNISSSDNVILTLGESTTAGLYIPFEDSYPKQLERLLCKHFSVDNIKVLTPPHTGQNSSQMLHRFDEYLLLFQPKLVILMAGVNNEWSLAESNLGAFMPSSDWKTVCFYMRQWTDDIKLVRFLRLLLTSSRYIKESFKSNLEDQPLRTNWPPKSDFLVNNIGSEPFMKLWRHDIGQMISKSQKNKTRVILMTYPNYESPPASEFTAISKKYSIPLIENHKSFLPFLEQNRQDEVFFADRHHPNKKGYSIVARNVLQCILKNKMEQDILPSSTTEKGIMMKK